MAKTVRKITLSASRDIPFNKLVLSQGNVRRIKAGVSLDDLAEDIARRTLLQGLTVRPLLDADGAETGMFEVPAGGRRYRALELLVRQKRLATTAPVPCIVRAADSDASAEEDSLAENVQRVALHPLDQFRAFQALRDQGAGDNEIAARFFVTPAVVRQRLRLTAVSPRLCEIYAEDGMTLEQLMAFSVSDDHVRQEQVWEAVQQGYNQDPYRIRRMLTESTVRASDRRALFVGIEAYAAAGGGVMRDLFDDDDGGWLDDPALLDRLTAEKLKAAAETIAAEGWKWIEVAVDHPYGYAHGLRRLKGTQVEPTTEEAAEIEALKAEYARLEGEYEGADELPDEIDARLGEIETGLARLEDRPVSYDPADIAMAGAFVGIDADGTLLVDRGHVRPEDDPPVAAEPECLGDDQDTDFATDPGTASDPGSGPATGSEAPTAAEPSSPGEPRVVVTGRAEPESDADDAIRPLSDRLLAELSAHRTLALRDAVAINPQVAITALLHKLVLDAFRPGPTPGCLAASVCEVFFPVQAADLKDSPPAMAIAERNAAWERDLPEDNAALWDWLAALDDASRMALLAHCVSYGVNAVHEKLDRYGYGPTRSGLERRLADADRLAQAVGLDMVEAGWRPTVDNYLGRVSKARILDAVREARGEQAAQRIAHLKKPEMAREAERLLEGSGWLPEPLRRAGSDNEAPATVPESETGALLGASAEADDCAA